MIVSFLRGLLGGRPPANSQPANSQPANSQPANSQPANSQPAKSQPPAEREPRRSESTERLSPAVESREPVVLSFRLALDRPISSEALAAPPANRLPPSEPADRGRPQPSPASRSEPLSLRRAGLGSAAQRRALRAVGVRTTAELLAADPAELAQQLRLSPRAAATLRRWQRAIRLSRLLPAMKPRDALLLHAVHRKTLRSIAGESPRRLHRDLQRYALSTAGIRLLQDHPLPSADQIRAWVETARSRTAAKKSRRR